MKKMVCLVLFSLIACETAFTQEKGAKGERPPKETHKVDKKEADRPQRHDPLESPIRHTTAARVKATSMPINFSVLQVTADEIFMARPELTEDILTADAHTVETAMAAIKAEFRKRGLTPEDARDAMMSGWKLLRVRLLGLVEPMAPEVFVKTVTGLGKLVLKTTPAGARIWIDGEPVKDKYGRDVLTETCRWPSAGPHKIKLVLDDQHRIIEEDLNIEEGTPVIFERSLDPLKRP